VLEEIALLNKSLVASIEIFTSDLQECSTNTLQAGITDDIENLEYQIESHKNLITKVLNIHNVLIDFRKKSESFLGATILNGIVETKQEEHSITQNTDPIIESNNEVRSLLDKLQSFKDKEAAVLLAIREEIKFLKRRLDESVEQLVANLNDCFTSTIEAAIQDDINNLECQLEGYNSLTKVVSNINKVFFDFRELSEDFLGFNQNNQIKNRKLNVVTPSTSPYFSKD
jgi:hypothetical protein